MLARERGRGREFYSMSKERKDESETYIELLPQYKIVSFTFITLHLGDFAYLGTFRHDTGQIYSVKVSAYVVTSHIAFPQFFAFMLLQKKFLSHFSENLLDAPSIYPSFLNNPFIYLSINQSIYLSIYLSMFPFIFVSISFIYLLMHAYICLSIICISYYLFLCLLLFIYLSNLTIYLFTCFFLSHFFCTVTHVPLCISLSLSKSQSYHISLSVCLSLPLSLSLFRSLSLSLSLYLSLSLFVSLSLSLTPSLSFRS